MQCLSMIKRAVILVFLALILSGCVPDSPKMMRAKYHALPLKISVNYRINPEHDLIAAIDDQSAESLLQFSPTRRLRMELKHIAASKGFWVTPVDYPASRQLVIKLENLTGVASEGLFSQSLKISIAISVAGKNNGKQMQIHYTFDHDYIKYFSDSNALDAVVDDAINQVTTQLSKNQLFWQFLAEEPVPSNLADK